MTRRKDMLELAALLDGELDARRAEELYAQMQADPGLRAEYELQREAKLALSELPKAQAPGFIVTRIMGEIASQRGVRNAQQSAWRWRTLAAAVGGFAACLLLVTGVLYLNAQRQAGFNPAPVTTLVGQPHEMVPFSAPGRGVLPLDDWGELTIPAGTSAGTADFLRFANDAHNYSRMTSTAKSYTPDVTPAIQILDGKVIVILEGEVYTFEDENAEAEE